MSALRFSVPGHLELIDQGPARWQPIPGFSYRPHAIGGVVILPRLSSAVSDARREQLVRNSAAYRARGRK